MRLSPLAVGLAIMGLAATAGAQTIPFLDWSVPSPETQAAPAWFGSTGLVRVPTAMVAPPLRVTGGAHRIELDDESQDILTANVGLPYGLEVGVTRIGDMRPRGAGTGARSDEFMFNAKYRINLGGLFELIPAPQVAVGVLDASDRFDRALYVALSHNFPLQTLGAPSSVNAHVGFGRTEHRIGALDGMFFGVDFSPFPRALVQIEYDAEDVNAAMRYYFSEWLAADVGIVDGDFGWGLSVRAGF